MSRRETPLESHIQVRNLIAKLQYHITHKTLPPTQLSPNEVTRLNELFHANQYFNRFATPKQLSTLVVGQMKTKATIDASGSLPRPKTSQMRPMTNSAKVSSAPPPPIIAYAGDEPSGASTGLALPGRSSAVGYTPGPSAASARWAINTSLVKPLVYSTPGGAPVRPPPRPGATPTANVQNTNAHSANPEQQFAVSSVPNLPQSAPHHNPVVTPPPSPPADTSAANVKGTNGHSAKPEQRFAVNPAHHHYAVGTSPPLPPSTSSQQSNASQAKSTAPTVNPAIVAGPHRPGSGKTVDAEKRSLSANLKSVLTPAPKPTNTKAPGRSVAASNPNPPTQKNKVPSSRPMVLSTPLVPGKPVERTSTALSSNVPVPPSKPTASATTAKSATLNAPANVKSDVPSAVPKVANAPKQSAVPAIPAQRAAAAKPSVASTSHVPSPQPPAKKPVPNVTAANTATQQKPPAAAQQPEKVVAHPQTSQIQPKRNTKPRLMSQTPITSSSTKKQPKVQMKPVVRAQQQTVPSPNTVQVPQASADQDVDMDGGNASTNVGTVPAAAPAPPSTTTVPPPHVEADYHMDTTPDPVPRPAVVASTVRTAPPKVQTQLPPTSVNATVKQVPSAGFIPSVPAAHSVLAKPTAPPQAPSLLARLQPAPIQGQAPLSNCLSFAPVQNGPASNQSTSLTPQIPSLPSKLGPSQALPAAEPKKTDSHPSGASAVAALPTPGFSTGLGHADKAKVVIKQTKPISGQPSAALIASRTGSPHDFYRALLDMPSPDPPKHNPILINFVLSPTASPSDASSGYAKELNSGKLSTGVFADWDDDEDADDEDVEMELETEEDRSRGLTLDDLVTTKEAAARLASSPVQHRQSNDAKKVRFAEVEDSSSSDETSSTVEDSDDTHDAGSTIQDHRTPTISQTSTSGPRWSPVDITLLLFSLSWLLLSYVF